MPFLTTRGFTGFKKKELLAYSLCTMGQHENIAKSQIVAPHKIIHSTKLVVFKVIYHWLFNYATRLILPFIETTILIVGSFTYNTCLGEAIRNFMMQYYQ